MRKVIAFIGASTVASCQMIGLDSNVTTISSVPSGAQVTVEGFGGCVTPCTVEHDKDRLVRIAKAGYQEQRFVLRRGQGKLTVTLELSAPTEAVEEDQLPEL